MEIGDEIFGFRSFEDFLDARANVPLWAKILGPISCGLAGIAPVPDPVGRAVLAIGTNRVIPDVGSVPFFQTE
jgi:hypothetical protein